MPDKKLKLSHKIAGVIDRLIKSTRVKTVDLSVLKGIISIPVIIESSRKRLIPHITYNNKSINFNIQPVLIEIIGVLNANKVNSVSLKDLKTNIKSEPLEIYHINNVYDMNTFFTTVSIDFFEEFKVSKKLSYRTKINNLSFSIIKPNIIKLHTFKFPIIKDNLFLIKRYRITKKSVQLSYLSEKQQLNYWRRAVITTRKEPKLLEFIGVYYQVPYYDIEKMKVNYKLKELSYNLKENIIAKKTRICNIIVFRDIIEKKGVIIEE